MKYIGQFRNIIDTLYQVEIISNNDESEIKEIILSEDAFKVEFNADSTIYDTFKLSNATVTLISNEYLFDLYNSTNQGVKVTLTDLTNSKIEYIGYVTPASYNQNWENEYENIELECIDAISTLDNYKYTTIDPDNKKIKSFQDIIINCIKKCNCIKNIYINQNCYLSRKSDDSRIYNQITYHYITNVYNEMTEGYFTSTFPVATQLSINLNNEITFTIEKGYKKSQTYYYVKDLSTMSVTPTFDNVYKYQKELIDDYYDVTGTTSVNIIDKLFISEQNFFTTNDDNDDKIDDGKSYKDVLESIIKYLGYTLIQRGEDIFILDYDYIKNGYIDYTLLSSSDNFYTYNSSVVQLSNLKNIDNNSFKRNGANLEISEVYNRVKITTSENNISNILPEFFKDDDLTNVKSADANWNDYTDFTVGDYNYYQKYYKNKKYKTHYYDNDIDWNELTIDRIYYSTLTNKIGASFIREANLKSDDNSNIPSFSNYIVLHRHLEARNDSNDKSIFDSKKNTLHPLITLNEKIPESSFLYDNYYLIISANVLFDDRSTVAYRDTPSDRANDDSYSTNNLCINALLKIGNKWWNGLSWITTKSTFKIYLDKKDEKHLYYKWFSVKNNVEITDFLEKSGQKININSNYQLVGDVTFEIYTPINILNSYRIDTVWIKDLSIDLCMQNKNIKSDTNTEYKNVINIDFIKELSDISLDVISDTNKGLNYSVVIEKPTEIIGYVNNNNLCTKTFEINQKPEFNLIQKYVNQYSEPHKILNLTLENIYQLYTLFTIDTYANDKYIVNSMSIDYYNNTNEIQIVEKV